MWKIVESIPRCSLKVVEELKDLVLQLAADGSNSQLFYAPVSPAEQKAFCRNEGGWPRNDIDLFINMENQKVASEILSRLEEIPQKGFPSDENPDVIRLSLQSKYCQTESEVTRWIESQLEYKEIEAERQRLDADEKLSLAQKEAALKEFRDNLTNEDRDVWLLEKRKQRIQEMLENEKETSKKK